jgi:glucokinase
VNKVLGVDVGGTNTKVVVLREDQAVVHRQSFKTQAEAGPVDFVQRLAKVLQSVQNDAGEVTGLGLAVAGLVDLDGNIVQAPNLDRFVGHDLAGEVQRHVPGLTFALDNDVNAALWGEARAGVARGARNVVMLSLGTGVGGGLLLDGRLYHGSGGTAAELGHTLLDYQGPVCPCGQRGHVESYLSTAAIVARTRAALEATSDAEGAILRRILAEEGELSPRVLSRAAEADDPVATAVMDELGWMLGLACANLVNAFNPELVVIGGGVSGSGDALLAPARKAMVERGMPRPVSRVALRQAELGTDGAAIGAGHLALDALGG